MKYKSVKIKTIRIWIEEDSEIDWYYYLESIPGDRIDNETTPHPLGHYHYPETMDDEEAFNRLKQCMVDAHLKEIEDYQRSLDKLQKLRFKPKQGES
jgi:hypothetical protein